VIGVVFVMTIKKTTIFELYGETLKLRDGFTKTKRTSALSVKKMVKLTKYQLLVIMEVCAAAGFVLGMLAARTIWDLWHIVG
jgi:hypothetical protein